VTCLGLLDAEVIRNGYGRQVHSFETDLAIPCLNHGGKAFRAVFIRAPRVTKVGPDVEVLARLNGDAVMLRRGNILATGFHPELTDDLRVQQYFLSMF
jgi:5'-phosphate synthase pdxT subunit